MPDPQTGEPTGNDVAAYTQGALAADDTRTTLLLTGALAAARAYCGWHVVGEKEETIRVDGPGSPLLVLPTHHLIEIAALSEDGIEVDVDTLEWSARGLVFKPHRLYWTAKYRGIEATITHGFTAVPDFNAAVLSAVDRLGAGGREVVGPFQFPDTGSAGAGSAFSEFERAILDLYRLEPKP